MDSEDNGYGQWERNNLLERQKRLIPQSWKKKWGACIPPKSHFYLWRTVYHPYLFQLFEEFLRGYRKVRFRKITFKEFVSFVYKVSSGYITPYA